MDKLRISIMHYFQNKLVFIESTIELTHKYQNDWGIK